MIHNSNIDDVFDEHKTNYKIKTEIRDLSLRIPIVIQGILTLLSESDPDEKGRNDRVSSYLKLNTKECDILE